MEISNLKPSEVRFLKELHQREFSSLFHVIVREQECVLKVYNNAPGAELTIFQREKAAYNRLAEHGLCAAGVVPKFYGSIEQIQIEDWTPHLDMFNDSDVRLNANLIEYLPDIREMDLTTYSKERMEKAVSTLQRIHAAGVLHGDPFPRNIIISGKNPGRVVWIDFDRAHTYTGKLMDHEKWWMNHEKAMIDQLATKLAKDVVGGKIKEAWGYYYEGMEPSKFQEKYGPGSVDPSFL